MIIRYYNYPLIIRNIQDKFMKAYSQDLRERIIGAYEKNTPIPEIVALFNVCRSTVDDWIQRFIDTGDYSSMQGKLGQPPYKFNDKQAILDFITKNPDADGIAIRDAVAPELAMSTFYDTLKRLGITFKKKSRNTSSAKNKSARNLSKRSPA